MAADRSRLPGARVPAVIAALDVERATLASGPTGARAICYQSGPGAARAEVSAAGAIAGGAAALVSWGLAGALVPALRPGTVVLADRVLTSDGRAYSTDEAWRARLQRALAPHCAVTVGAMLTVPAALISADAKAGAARESGAVAVDMESAGIAAAAERARVPFAVIRIIVDAASDALPPDAEQWIDERGNRRASAALAAVWRPSRWPLLLRLARRYDVARRVLTQVGAVLSAESWCLLPGEPL